MDLSHGRQREFGPDPVPHLITDRLPVHRGLVAVGDGLQDPLARERVASQRESTQRRVGSEADLDAPFANVARDPVSEQPYGYRMFNAMSYELCGTFDRETADNRAEDFWTHGVGQQCFMLNLKP